MSSAIQILHHGRVPTTGCLVVPGQLGVAELPHLAGLFAGRPITWLIEENETLDPQLEAALEGSGGGAAFSDDDSDPAAAGAQLQPAIAEGGVLIFVPGSAAARPSTPCHIPGKTLTTLGRFGLPILPIAIDHPRESSLSIEKSSSLPQSVLVIGREIPAASVSAAAIQQGLLEASEEAFSNRSFLKGSLATALLEGLKKHGSKTKVLDGSDDSEL
ncbi:MAG: 2-acyl-glycerophospho-ethanolamine acyltransferase, partial [Verrucomicrobiota bacterium]